MGRLVIGMAAGALIAVAAMVPAKKDELQIMFSCDPKKEPVTEGDLLEVDWVGFGLVRMTRAAMQLVWDAAKPEDTYLEKGEERRSIFKNTIENGLFVGEDVYFCRQYKALGGRVWVDTSFRAGHVGFKTYTIPPVEELQ